MSGVAQSTAAAVGWSTHRREDGTPPRSFATSSGDSAVLFVKILGFLDIFLSEKQRVWPVEKPTSDPPAKKVPDAIAKHRREEHAHYKNVNVKVKRISINKKSGGKKDGVARQEKADKQAGLGKNNRTHHKDDYPWASSCSKVCKVESGNHYLLYFNTYAENGIIKPYRIGGIRERYFIEPRGADGRREEGGKAAP